MPLGWRSRVKIVARECAIDGQRNEGTTGDLLLDVGRSHREVRQFVNFLKVGLLDRFGRLDRTSAFFHTCRAAHGSV